MEMQREDFGPRQPGISILEPKGTDPNHRDDIFNPLTVGKRMVLPFGFTVISPSLCNSSISCDLINDRAIARLRDRLSMLACRLQPCLLGFEHLSQSFFRSGPECRAMPKIRDVCDVTIVLFAMEQINVIVSHCSSPS